MTLFMRRFAKNLKVIKEYEKIIFLITRDRGKKAALPDPEGTVL